MKSIKILFFVSLFFLLGCDKDDVETTDDGTPNVSFINIDGNETKTELEIRCRYTHWNDLVGGYFQIYNKTEVINDTLEPNVIISFKSENITAGTYTIRSYPVSNFDLTETEVKISVGENCKGTSTVYYPLDKSGTVLVEDIGNDKFRISVNNISIVENGGYSNQGTESYNLTGKFVYDSQNCSGDLDACE